MNSVGKLVGFNFLDFLLGVLYLEHAEESSCRSGNFGERSSRATKVGSEAGGAWSGTGGFLGQLEGSSGFLADL